MKKYKRVLLKLSGEALMGNMKFGYDQDIINRICADILDVYNMGIQLCIVIGGGNILRGNTSKDIGIDKASGDYMGMLATIMNAIALQNLLEQIGISTRVQSAMPINAICETYARRKAIRHMEKGRVVIFAGGTGNPFFTTDTASALRAIEMNCDLLLKGTQVDGVYDSDPKKNEDAKRYTKLTYKQVLDNDLKVMDASAISLARENNLPIAVFSIKNRGSFEEVIKGKGEFTIIS